MNMPVRSQSIMQKRLFKTSNISALGLELLVGREEPKEYHYYSITEILKNNNLRQECEKINAKAKEIYEKLDRGTLNSIDVENISIDVVKKFRDLNKEIRLEDFDLKTLEEEIKSIVTFINEAPVPIDTERPEHIFIGELIALSVFMQIALKIKEYKYNIYPEEKETHTTHKLKQDKYVLGTIFSLITLFNHYGIVSAFVDLQIVKKYLQQLYFGQSKLDKRAKPKSKSSE
jgi:hypothetical protein